MRYSPLPDGIPETGNDVREAFPVELVSETLDIIEVSMTDIGPSGPKIATLKGMNIKFIQNIQP